MLTDALEKDIIIGNTYGYTIANNGINSVVVGRAIKTSVSKVTLEVISSKSCAYEGPLKNSYSPEIGKKVNVYGLRVFPVTI